MCHPSCNLLFSLCSPDASKPADDADGGFDAAPLCGRFHVLFHAAVAIHMSYPPCHQFSRGFIDILTDNNVWATDKPTFVSNGRSFWAHSVCVHFSPQTFFDNSSLSWQYVSKVSEGCPTASAESTLECISRVSRGYLERYLEGTLRGTSSVPRG